MSRNAGRIPEPSIVFDASQRAGRCVVNTRSVKQQALLKCLRTLSLIVQ